MCMASLSLVYGGTGEEIALAPRCPAMLLPLPWQMLLTTRHSAVRAWKNNGHKNGWAASDPTTENGMRDITDNGINAMGMVNIPICNFEEAYDTLWPNSKSKYFPCPDSSGV